ncbi:MULTISPECIES: SDR family oxidoreductase [Clavibacter]|uniref:SDR family NAD(P)-dependent oxidoreductase n=2 Tax=Clavibacter TaxID=1573 RepID=A0A399NPC8_9MICO|nr:MULTISPECIES: SDR family NAD(P)-dependent oxidoreductase [Clavibacter]KDP90978.1 short-chain dehydrogenase [Clavibacter cf. michiganensis LMG 26808]RII96013.1 SDR family NAD(P)-dependent oxidoreductase [Clavibacter michiganensis]UKF25841.1 SDR family NAD(P)-dependent oxidoreductase [Clavibacter sp. A6099]
MQIQDAVVVITGASSGIGAATARAAAAAGARVVLAARREERIRQLAAEIGGDAIAVRCDVTDASDVAALAQAALDAFGRIDVLVNNAGQGLQSSVEALALDDLRAVLELNLVAPLATMQAVIPTMRAQGTGAIVNVSSGTTFADVPGTGGYVASKIALERLSAIARAELDGTGIVVSTLIPFATETEFMASIRAGRAEAEAMTAGATFDTPETVAPAVLALVASGDARMDLVPAAYGGSR